MHQHNLPDVNNSMQVALIGFLAGTMSGACAKTQCHTDLFDLDVTADLAKGGSTCQDLCAGCVSV